MNDIELMQKLIYIKKYPGILTHEQMDIVHKLVNQTTERMFEEICNEKHMCPVCGKELNSEGHIMVQDGMYKTTHKITVTICPDDNCAYNKEMIAKYQEEFEYKTAGLSRREIIEM